VEAGFKIERLSGADYLEIAKVGANVQAYSDTTVESGKNYCYRVKAFNAAGVSPPTNAACATAPSSSTGSGDGNSSPPPSTPPPPPSSPPASIPAASSGDTWKDYELRLSLRSTDNDRLGVMFRYQDPNNFYRFSWTAEGKERRLEKRVNGVFHVLASDGAVYTQGRTYALQISVRGSSLTVAVGEIVGG
jgi:hypothetical protein